MPKHPHSISTQRRQNLSPPPPKKPPKTSSCCFRRNTHYQNYLWEWNSIVLDSHFLHVGVSSPVTTVITKPLPPPPPPPPERTSTVNQSGSEGIVCCVSTRKNQTLKEDAVWRIFKLELRFGSGGAGILSWHFEVQFPKYISKIILISMLRSVPIRNLIEMNTFHFILTLKKKWNCNVWWK